MDQVNQVAIDACILPIPLYFEPEEIAAACIAVGAHLFANSKPVFVNNHFKSKAREINNSNSYSVSVNSVKKPLLTGKQIWDEKCGKNSSFPTFDFLRDWNEIKDDQTLKTSQPDWFKHILRSNKNHTIGSPQLNSPQHYIKDELKVENLVVKQEGAEDEPVISVQVVSYISMYLFKSMVDDSKIY